MDLNENIKYWLKVIFPISILLQLFSFSLFGSFNFLSNLNVTDHWQVLNSTGAYFGISALMFSIAKSKVINHHLFVGLIILGYFIFFIDIRNAYTSPSANLMVILAPLGVYTLFKQLHHYFFERQNSLSNLYFLLTFLFILMGWSTQTALKVNTFILPYVYDIDIYKIDSAFGNITLPFVQWFEISHAFWNTLLLEVYSLLSVSLFVVVSLFIRENKDDRYHVIRVLIVPFGLAFICYTIIPVSGPVYAFATEYFPLNMPTASALQSGKVFIPPAARNGMPSMHLTGALLIWLLTAGLSKKIYFYIATVFTLLTAVATIALGEHYVLDLVVALPFSAFIGIGLANPDNFVFKNKKVTTLWVGAGVTFTLWMLMLLTSAEWLSNNLLFVQVFAIWSVLIATILFGIYIKYVWNDTEVVISILKIEDAKKTEKSTTPRWVIGVFVASGFAGLLYEVVYAKSLAVTFGSTSLASYTVLTTYMSGMALGAWLGGYIADKVKKLLLYYAGIEAFIGLYAVITPFLFKVIQNIYVISVTGLSADDPYVTFLRVALGVIVLGIPTILMGATLPIMFKYLKQLNIQSDTAISRLYSANVIGAALGSFIGGYFFISAIGRIGATNLAAVFSLMIALYTIGQFKIQNTQLQEFDNFPPVLPHIFVPKILGIMALIVLTIGGAVTLGLEVVSIHMLAVVAGNSVYAFALMLAVFLLGLGLGSIFGKKALNYIDRTTLIVLAQCGIAASIIITALLWDKIPAYFASFGEMQNYIHLGFWAREILRGVICALAMLPATLFIGATYPAAMSLAADWLGQGSARGLGISSALNTIGNISGVLLVGFLLLPLMGSNKVFLLLAVVSLILAVLVLLCLIKVNYKFNPYTAGVVISIFLLFLIYPKNWNFTSLAQGANVYFMPSYWGNVIDHTESIEGGVTSVTRSSDGKYITLLTNGKFQGNNSGETLAQESFALIPLMHNSERKSALAIGYGTGMTARVLHEQGFENLDVVELSKDIVFMANKYFSDINHNVINQSGVNLIYTDGRNFLLTQDEKYDLISLEITSIWFAGAANLYNKEFYELSQKRLNKEGVLQQWVQLHHMHPIDLVYILNTVRSVYKHVWLYSVGGQGIIIASNSDEALKSHSLKYPYNSLTIDELKNKEKFFKDSIVLSPKGVNNLAYKTDKTLRHLISTDNNLYLEYATPKGNAIMEDTLTKNLEYLSKFEK
nr:fused MFS/spermidine synthase [Moraxella sp. CTOTU47618]